MKIDKDFRESTLEVTVQGRLDAISAPQFEEDVAGSLDGITKLVIGMGEVEYLSSAGLRALLYLQQLMEEKGELIIRDVPPIVKDIFELTGFTEIVTVE